MKLSKSCHNGSLFGPTKYAFDMEPPFALIVFTKCKKMFFGLGKIIAPLNYLISDYYVVFFGQNHDILLPRGDSRALFLYRMFYMHSDGILCLRGVIRISTVVKEVLKLTAPHKRSNIMLL